MRRLAIGLIFTISLTLLPDFAFSASPKAGSVCLKLNQVKILNGVKFTCVKSGKKLLWTSRIIPKSSPTPKPTLNTFPSDSAKPIQSPASSPTPITSPQPSTSPTPAASGSSKPLIEPAAITSIAELPSRYKDIRYLSWLNTWKQVNSAKEIDSPIEILIGPNSKSCYTDETIKAFRLLQKVYSGSKIPKKVWILYADSDKDRKWLEEKTLTLLPRPRVNYNNQGQMLDPETVNPSGEGVLWALDSCFHPSAYNFSSQVLHGYTHTIQDLQYSENENSYGRWGEVPRWLIEGGAVWSQVFYNDHKNLDRYLRSGDWGILSGYDSKFFQDYLIIPEYNNNIWAYTDKWPGMRAYDLGAFLCEMLVALRGPDSIIELNKEYLKVGSFEVAFKNIYGLSWKEAQPYFSESVYNLIKWLAA